MNVSPGLDPRQVRDLVIRLALRVLGMPGGEVAERLVFATAAHESDGFRYIHQLGKGPALSLWQIEPATAQDTLNRLPAKWRLALEALRIGPVPILDQLPGNLYLGAGLCRAVYFMKPFSMPATASPEDLAAIWKMHYNSAMGAGRIEDFVRHYRESVLPVYEA